MNAMGVRKDGPYLWLLEHVDYQGDDCLPWPFSKDSRTGRGLVCYEGVRDWAHRKMCKLAHGEPPTPRYQAAHNCGKGHYGCVNPKHLEWKTNSQNQLDRRKNGNMLRNPRGMKGNLRPDQALKILDLRQQGLTQVEIGKRLGVSLGCVQYWLKYRTVRGNDAGKARAYTNEEEEILRQQKAAGKSYDEIAAVLGRSRGSVAIKASRLGIA